jgi:hypothetical protein
MSEGRGLDDDPAEKPVVAPGAREKAQDPSWPRRPHRGKSHADRVCPVPPPSRIFVSTPSAVVEMPRLSLQSIADHAAHKKLDTTLGYVQIADAFRDHSGKRFL